jgi:hypothetical protein
MSKFSFHGYRHRLAIHIMYVYIRAVEDGQVPGRGLGKVSAGNSVKNTTQFNDRGGAIWFAAFTGSGRT